MPGGTAPSRIRLVLAFLMSAVMTSAGLSFLIQSLGSEPPAAFSQADSAVLMAFAQPKAPLPRVPAPALVRWDELPRMDLLVSMDVFALPAVADETAAPVDVTEEAAPADQAAEPAPSPTPAPPAVVVRQAPPPAPPPPAPPTPTARPAPPAAPVGLSALEQQLFDAQNAERARAGVAALRLDAGLEGVARRRAQDMATRGYFSHTSPTGETAFSLIDAAGIDAPYAAENIGFNNYADSSSASAIMSAFMSSPGHRANVLNGTYTRVGVAMAVAANGTKYYAVVFGGP